MKFNGAELRKGMEIFVPECNTDLEIVRIVTDECPVRAKDSSGRIFIGSLTSPRERL